MRLQALLRPRSVAIVGASDNVGPGFNAWNALQHVGYQGEIHLVNPNKPELFGRPTYKSLAYIPGRIDAALRDRYPIGGHGGRSGGGGCCCSAGGGGGASCIGGQAGVGIGPGGATGCVGGITTGNAEIIGGTRSTIRL